MTFYSKSLFHDAMFKQFLTWWQGRCVILLKWSLKCFVSYLNMNIDPVGGIFSQGLALIERGAKDKSFALVYHDFCTKFEDLL